MATIQTEQRQYLTYVITRQDTPVLLEVVPERGGIITRWQVNNRDILYLDTDRFTDPSLSIRGGIPILFPICGNLPDNRYTDRGQTYTLKQHGFARDLPWQVIGQTLEPDPSITLQLVSNDQTRAVYPFEFELRFTYTLERNQLVIYQQYTNLSDRVMPFSTGFHPYFQVADKQQLTFDIPATTLQDQRAKTLHPFAGSFDFEQDEIDVAFQNLPQPTASVSDRNQGHRLTLSYSPQFSTLVFWTLKGKDFYCLEPWTAPRNALNTGENLLQLAPKNELELTFTLAVQTT
jgi:galactose mutarotase-like enzyme